MTGIADLLDDDARERLAPEPFPADPLPMLATLAAEPFDHPGWVYEPKLDGQRVLLLVRDGAVELRSRRGERLNVAYPELVAAAEAVDLPDLVADGEVVALQDGKPSFNRLQQRMGLQNAAKVARSTVEVHVYLFDLLHLGGIAVRELPLRARKALLGSLQFEDPYRRTDYWENDGITALAAVCDEGGEGLIAKDAGSRYVAGRSRSWQKLKCSQRQEVVIGGFTEPQGTRFGFGALLVGVHRDGELYYAGKVGTGYSHAVLRDLGQRLRDLEQPTSPFAERLPGRGVRYVMPELVAEVAFSEWTRDGRLRHPRFLGLRTDKDPQQVVREG